MVLFAEGSWGVKGRVFAVRAVLRRFVLDAAFRVSGLTLAGRGTVRIPAPWADAPEASTPRQKKDQPSVKKWIGRLASGTTAEILKGVASRTLLASPRQRMI